MEGVHLMKGLSATAVDSGIKLKKKRGNGFSAGRDIPVYLLLAPALALLIIFCYFPMYGIIIAFKDYNPFRGIIASPWVGFKYFAYFLSDENFWRVFKNTILLNLYYLLCGFPAPIILALLINEVAGKWFKKTVQTISYLPYFISWVVVSGIAISVLSPTSGIINIMLQNVFGIEPIYFLAKPEYFRTIVIATWIWKEMGYYSVYYLAALTSIDPQLYEAARIDGASRWKQTLHITLPGIKSIAMVLFMLTIGNLVTVGIDQIFNLYNPLVYSVGDVISTYTYRLGLEKMQYSLTTAIGVTQSIINFLLIFSANKIVKKLNGWAMW